MNKRLVKYFWALPLLGMLSGCSDSEVSEGSQNANNAINFTVTTSKQSSSDGTTKSRATIVDNDAVRVDGSSFGLYAYSHSADWVKGTAPSTTPNFMNNQEVIFKLADGAWKYDPLKFWTDDKISFFGYLPYATSPLINGTGAAVTANAEKGAMPQVEFTQAMDAAKMVDFVASHAINKISGDGVVTLDFKHVLTRLNFKARLDEDLIDNSTTHVYVTGLKICGTKGYTDPADKIGATLIANNASRFFKKATFVLGDGNGTGNEADGQWKYEAGTNPTINAADPQDEALDIASIMPLEDHTLSTTTTVKQETKKVTVEHGKEVNQKGEVTPLLNTVGTKQHYLFLIPPYGVDGIKSEKDVIVELKYVVVTEDPDLEEGFTPTRTKTVAVSLPNGTLQQGKAYNIIFTVGLNPVRVDVNVSDWDKDETTKYAPSEKSNTNSNTDILAAWEELNKKKALTKTANYFVINVDEMPQTTPLDLRSKVDGNRFSAFEVGDQVELMFADEKAGNEFDDTKKVLVPNGWYYENRTVNGKKRHIISKLSNYITVVPTTDYDPSTQYNATDLNALLTQLNAAHTGDIHYYAVDFYCKAPAAALFNLSTLTGLENTLKKFDFDRDYLYIVFNEDNGASQNYAAPDGWEFTAVKSFPGKYLLKPKGTGSNTSATSMAVGETVFSNGGSFQLNK